MIRPRVETAPSILAARADLTDALAGLELDEQERRIVAWLLDWDQPTLHNIASIVRKARRTGVSP